MGVYTYPNGSFVNVGDILHTSTGISGGGVLVNFKPVPIHYGSPYDASLTIIANDGHVDSAPPFAVPVNVIHVNHPPTIGAVSAALNVPESLTNQFAIFQITASDVDVIDILTVTIAATPVSGSILGWRCATGCWKHGFR